MQLLFRDVFDPNGGSHFDPFITQLSSGGTRRGWLGGEESSSLDKWYGPDRALYLPGGLLDRDDLPDYLSGELPGE